MYNDDDVQQAVQAGILDDQTAQAFKNFVAQQRQCPAVDEENFKFVSSFNDIFVVIAIALLLGALGLLGGGLAVAFGAWCLAEFFTRQRKMSLPSIVLLFAYTGGIAFFIGHVLIYSSAPDAPDPLMIMLTACLTALATALHWWRFRVPITVAVGMASAIVVGMSPIMMIADQPKLLLLPYFFIAGLIVFALAMYWDMRDPTRTSSKTDVAFWLHLLAAPLLVHPVFVSLGSTGQLNVTSAGLIVLLYGVLALVSLVIDRRALMVSALIYVMYALNTLMKTVGDMGIQMVLTAFILGAMLLLLSAFWQYCRAFLMRHIPLSWQARLPPFRQANIA